MENKIEKIVVWIQEKVKEAKADGVIVGLSGGIDSSCVTESFLRKQGVHYWSLLLSSSGHFPLAIYNLVERP